jgi:Domain of unknown function (DUF397)
VEDPVGRPFNGHAGGSSSANLAQPDLGSGVSFTWQKSSYCGYNGDCVEVADMGHQIGVRDSKAGSASPVLRFDRGAWAAFVADIKGGTR